MGSEPPSHDGRRGYGVLECERREQFVITQMVEATCGECYARGDRTRRDGLRELQDRIGRELGLGEELSQPEQSEGDGLHTSAYGDVQCVKPRLYFLFMLASPCVIIHFYFSAYLCFHFVINHTDWKHPSLILLLLAIKQQRNKDRNKKSSLQTICSK